VKKSGSEAGYTNAKIGKYFGYRQRVSYVGFTAFAGLPTMRLLGNLESPLEDGQIRLRVIRLCGAKDFTQLFRVGTTLAKYSL
jgi:hypothetical protein